MGYHVTILRTSSATTPVPISREEVMTLLASRPDLTHSEGSAGSIEFGPGGAPDAPLLVWQDGEIWTDGPDEPTLELMLELAEIWGARVRGDERETYRTASETYLHPDDRTQHQSDAELVQELLRKRRIRQWGLNVAIFGIFALLFLLVRAFSGR
jgi:hypothetical protein